MQAVLLIAHLTVGGYVLMLNGAAVSQERKRSEIVTACFVLLEE